MTQPTVTQWVFTYRVWRNSEEKVVFEGQRRFMMAGDSAYPLSPTMMKPYKDPTTRQKRFNRALSGLRTVTRENVIRK